MAPARPSPLYPRIYAAVARIPRGRVATYGGIARLAGIPRHARQVGYALHALPGGSRVPWHRVVGADGRVKPRGRDGPAEAQRALLERERVRFDASGRIDLARYGWPEGPGTTAPKSI